MDPKNGFQDFESDCQSQPHPHFRVIVALDWCLGSDVFPLIGLFDLPHDVLELRTE